MRAVDLLGARVYDRDGAEIGTVRDLHFEARGRAVVDSGRPAYRLTELECGSVGVAHRLGYGHRDLAGPWPLDRILSRMARRSLMVRWDQIAGIEGPRIRLSVVAGDLKHIGEDDDD